jgi:hypothetical protein
MRNSDQEDQSAGNPMQDIIKTILDAKRKHFLHSKSIFHFFAPASEMDLFMTARKLNCKLVVNLSRWLRAAGYGDINDTLIFRNDYFSIISEGALAGCVTFARDEQGNSYAFSQKNGCIYYVDRHGEIYARMADSFLSFLQELIRRDYNLPEWRADLPEPQDLTSAAEK